MFHTYVVSYSSFQRVLEQGGGVGGWQGSDHDNKANLSSTKAK